MRARLPAAIGAVLAVMAAGCGSTSPPGSRHATVRPAAAAPPGASSPGTLRRSKRRYLAHFAGGCRDSSALAAANANVLQRLTALIGHGNVAAVGALRLYLQRLADAFGQGLRGTQALGPPPEPDSRYGRAYLEDAGRMIASIRAMGDAVGRLDGNGLRRASQELHRATVQAHAAAVRYGFPTCGGGPSSTPPPPSGGPLV